MFAFRSAGYGKSTTLSSWLEQCGHKSALLSLDEDDNNLVTFVNYFVAAIQNVISNFGKKTAALINVGEVPSVKIIGKQIVNDLYKLSEDFIFVIDDYHLIKNISAKSIVN